MFHLKTPTNQVVRTLDLACSWAWLRPMAALLAVLAFASPGARADEVLYSDNFEASDPETRWTLTGDWRVRTSSGCLGNDQGFASPFNALVFDYGSSCSYANNRSGFATLLEPVTLPLSKPDVSLRWNDFVGAELGADFYFVQVSTDDGATWPYEIFRDSIDEKFWDQESVDLSQFVGQTIRIRFGFTSDSTITGPGWYIDDLQVVAEDLPAGVSAVAINGAQVDEGDAGETDITFTINVSPVNANPITLEHATINGTALAGLDYVGSSGLVTIPANTASYNLTLKVRGDSFTEGNETFSVKLTNPSSNAVIASGTAVGTIIDDESLTCSYVEDFEPKVGSFRWTTGYAADQSQSSEPAVIGLWHVEDDSACIPAQPGYSSPTHALAFKNLASCGYDNPLGWNATNPANPTIYTRMVNSEPIPPLGSDAITAQLSFSHYLDIAYNAVQDAVTTASVQVSTGGAGGPWITVREFKPSAPSPQNFVIPWQEEVISLNEYIGQAVMVRFVFFQPIEVDRNSANGWFIDDFKICYGQRPDGVSKVRILNKVETEGNAATKVLSFPVTISPANTADVTLSYETVALNGLGAATPGVDYQITPVQPLKTIPAGTISTTLDVLIIGDDEPNEGNESFLIKVTPVTSNVFLVNQNATGTIQDDDVPSTFTLSVTGVTSDPPEVPEGIGTAQVVITIDTPRTVPITLQYETIDDTAVSGTGLDFQKAVGSITFPANTTTQTFPITILNDTVYEDPLPLTLPQENEQFFVKLSSLSPYADTGVARPIQLVDNDPDDPAISKLFIDPLVPAEVAEGSCASTSSEDQCDTLNQAKFRVELSQAQATATITMAYTTVNGTATAGEDYVASSGTVTFAPGQTVQNIFVDVWADRLEEIEETFQLVLSAPNGPVNPVITTSTCTISDDDFNGVTFGINGDRVFTRPLDSTTSAPYIDDTTVGGPFDLAAAEFRGYDFSTLYGFENNELVTIDLFSNAGTRTPVTGASFAPGVILSALAWDHTNGIAYAASTAGQLFTIDLDTAALTLVATAPGGATAIMALAVHPTTGRIYSISRDATDGGRLYVVIPGSWIFNLVGTMNAVDGGGATLQPNWSADFDDVTGNLLLNVLRASGWVTKLVNLADASTTSQLDAPVVNALAIASAPAPTATQWTGDLTADDREPSGFDFDGDTGLAGTGAGQVVASIGDVNSDTFDDYLITASSVTVNDLADAGQAFVLFGGPDGAASQWVTSYLNAQVSFAALMNGANGVLVQGVAASERVGISGAGFGDVNGDKIADFGIGFRGANNAGGVYLIYGNRDLPATINSSAVGVTGPTGVPGVRILGVDTNDLAGASVSGAGDMNADGLQDIIIGAPGAAATAPTDNGAAYVVFGSQDGIGTEGQLPLQTIKDYKGLIVTGEVAGNQFGAAVSGAGDVNGDGVDDIVVTAPNAAAGNGVAYVIYGHVDYNTNDGRVQDIQLARLLLPNPTGTNDPYNLVFYATVPPLGQLPVYLNPGTPGAGRPGFLPGIRITGQGGGFGAVAKGVGDVNGDAISDLIVTAPTFNGSALTPAHWGRTYLLRGTGSAAANIVAANIGTTIPGAILVGIDNGDLAGSSAAGAGDVNGDGKMDIIIGASGGASGGFDGEAYIVYGRSNLTGIVSLRDLAENTLNAPKGSYLFNTQVATGYDFGIAVSGAGDFDDDGISDLIVGRENGAFVFLGRSSVDTAVYKNRMRSGANLKTVEDIKQGDYVSGRVGTLGDGALSRPAGRVALEFRGGGTGNDISSASTQTVTLFRKPSPDVVVGANTPEDDARWIPGGVFWKVETDRRKFTESSMTFYYRPEEIEGFDLQRVRIYYAKPDATLNANTVWSLLPVQYDPDRGALTVKRFHDADAAQASFNGYYALVQADFVVTLGNEIPPVGLTSEQVSEDGPTVTVIEGTTLTYWHKKEKRLYATGEGKLKVTWQDINQQTSNSVDVVTKWPGDDFGLFQTYVANTTAVSLAQAGPITMKAWQLMSSDTTLATASGTSSSPANEVSNGRFRAGLNPATPTTTARALVMLTDADLFEQGNLYFQFVKVYPADATSILTPLRNIDIGTAVTAATDPAYQQYHDEETGAPFVAFPNSVHATASVRYPGFYNPTTRTGSVVFVNTAATIKPLLVFYQQGQKLIDALTGTLVLAPGTQNAQETFAWPHRSARYNPVWPAATALNTIVVSRQTGSQEIAPATFGTEIDVYVQNTPGIAGYNPNEEHALVAPYGSGQAVFALRNDLNASTTSLPWVLMTYSDPNDLDVNDEPRAKMKAWSVVMSTPDYPFSNWPSVTGVNDPYEGEAGQLVLPPYPLSTLRQSSDNQVNPQAYKDRNNSIWAISAGTVELTLFYPALPDFYFPPAYVTRYNGVRNFTSATPSDVPWLDGGLTPVSPQGKVVYTTVWPAEAPVMKLGEVLIEARQGLPQINGQCSVTVQYESNAAGTAQVAKGNIVKMIDPVVARGVALAEVPLDVDTALSGADITFPGLPPALSYRIKYDQANKQLVCFGRVVDPVAGFDYPLLNVLTTKDRDLLKGLSSNAAWDTACDNLYTAASTVVGVSEANVANAEVLALTSGDALNTGYVSLVFQNAASCAPLPVSVEIIKVEADINPGSIAVVKPSCVFEEKLTLLHTNDFGGAPNNFIFEWKTLPDEDGTIPDVPDGSPSDDWVIPDLGANNPNGGTGVNEITIKGPGLLTLTDNWFTVRYKRASGAAPWGTGFSDWAPPQLAPGWIKRVVGQINPFTQRAGGGGIAGAEAQFAAFSEDAPNVLGNMISLAGTRFTGSVPLNCENLDGFGLIPIYSTVLNRGATLSIDALSPINNPGVNNALILAASRINDLYMVLGNEAFADAADPTIAFGTDDGEYGVEATSIHAFMNQTSSLIEEELALLRGRDDTYAPGTEVFPFYNKLVWNFTKDFTGGEVAYALNYNLADAAVGGDGVISEQDAKDAFPQGHGDAWGHYLTAINTYYRLLRHPYFSWTNRSEGYLVGGQPVTVDYLDERKFAKSAAAKARTGAEIVNLEYRQGYVENPDGQWQDLVDTDSDRAWGFSEWAQRTGQGSFIDWAVGNAILPAVDPDPTHTGVTKIDRTTVAELVDVSNAFNQIQSQVDSADLGLNPLGLGTNVIPFDINPGDIDDGLTHFEQIYGRASTALNNAATAFDNANNSTQLLRRQADSQLAFERDVQDQELDFKARLIEIFGTPYSDDIGPGGTYPRGYDGPDLFHYMYTEETPLLRDGEIRQSFFKASTGGDNLVEINTTSGTSNIISNGTTTTLLIGEGGLSLPVTVKNYGDYNYTGTGSSNTSPTTGTASINFNLGLDSQGRIGVRKPAAWTGTRRAAGELQTAQSEVVQSLGALVSSIREYENFLDDIDTDIEVLSQQFSVNANKLNLKTSRFSNKKTLKDAIQGLRITAIAVNRVASIIEKIAEATAESIPTVTGIIIGFSNGVIIDGLAPVRGAFQTVAAVLVEVAAAIADGAEIAALALELEDEKKDLDLELAIDAADFNFEQYQALKELEKSLRGELPLRVAMYSAYESTMQAVQNYRTTQVKAEQTLEQLDIFRKRTSADIQGRRYKDMAFRIFRNEQLQKYRAQYDLAARYTYLAAKAYDYETTMLSTDPRAGQRFLTDIVKARQIGTVLDGEPQPGQGLANTLAIMSRNFGVLSGQLGFNNPQVETNRFSLRYELFRQLVGPDGDESWRALLDQDYFTAGVGKVDNLWEVPEFVQYCVAPADFGDVEPGLIIPFSTTITEGKNFFDKEVGGFDNSYDSTQFATKIRSVGIWFSNYDFFNLSNTPRVYLVPAGTDVLRSPTGSVGTKRYFKVLDQILPVPYPIGNADLDSPTWIPSVDGLDGQLQAIRRFGRLRAYHDSGEFSSDEVNSDSRLIGRSVWNTKWMLIIPGSTFANDAEEGLETFINGVDDGTGTRDGNGVKDIKVFFETYAFPRVKSTGGQKDAPAPEVTVLAEPEAAN